MRTPSLPLLPLVVAAALTVVAAMAAPAAVETPSAPAEPASQPADPLRVADLAWLAGAWRGEAGGAPILEHWTAPEDGVMIGIFHWGRETELYQILLLEDTADGVVLRLRHFGTGLLVAWEEKDAPVVFRSVEHGPGWALFSDDAEETTRMLYRLEPDGGRVVRVLNWPGDEESALDFTFRPRGE